MRPAGPERRRFLATFWMGLLGGSIPMVFAHESHHPQTKESHFSYDEPSSLLESAPLGDRNAYQADVIRDGEATWFSWLQFVPGDGDHLFIGKRVRGQWVLRERVSASSLKLARPTWTRSPRGELLLSVESDSRQSSSPRTPRWGIDLYRVQAEGAATFIARVSQNDVETGNAIRHVATADDAGQLWFAWQQDRGGQFDIVVARRSQSFTDETGRWVVSSSPRGDWHPSLAIDGRGGLCVAWDTHDGDSFNVLGRWFRDDAWQAPFALAQSPALECRARLAVDNNGELYALWEEGSENWGHEYRSLDKKWNNVQEDYGPLHRFRTLRVAHVSSRGEVTALASPIPAPPAPPEALRPQCERLGHFHERGALFVDGLNRLWIVYRHYRETQLACAEPVAHHIEEGWKIYARCLGAQGWSDPVAFDQHQRDGLQRLEGSAFETGVELAWTTGRTDRRKDPQRRGVSIGRVALSSEESTSHRLSKATRPRLTPKPAQPLSESRLGDDFDTDHELVFGDLHRHTDLSLCFPFFDGSLDDAYRYAIDVARLDFLGITDHTRDIARGDVLSQLWWRSVKEVDRHALSQTFFPYYAFERSHRDTDHNVISLRDDHLRNFPPPLTEYWDQIDRDTITIPHNPFIGKVWDHHDNEKRPLLEIYQGFRDQQSLDKAIVGLNKGYHLGFIASSDHLSTKASYAGVWTPKRDHESIFRSLQARRTFGSTTPIALRFALGNAWMGERVSMEGPLSFLVEIEARVPVRQIDLYRNGSHHRVLWIDENGSPTQRRLALTNLEVEPLPRLNQEDYYFVHVRLSDGNQAWSSPIWLTVP